MFELRIYSLFLASLLGVIPSAPVKAETRKVPQDHQTIQAAVDAAVAGTSCWSAPALTANELHSSQP